MGSRVPAGSISPAPSGRSTSRISRKRTGPGGPPGLQNRMSPTRVGGLSSTLRRFRQPPSAAGVRACSSASALRPSASRSRSTLRCPRLRISLSAPAFGLALEVDSQMSAPAHPPQRSGLSASRSRSTLRCPRLRIAAALRPAASRSRSTLDVRACPSASALCLVERCLVKAGLPDSALRASPRSRRSASREGGKPRPLRAAGPRCLPQAL